MHGTLAVPALIPGIGDHAARRFLEFFAAGELVIGGGDGPALPQIFLVIRT
jgi:hypothetical protein